MKRLALAAWMVAACDTVDDRPATLQYIDTAILQPTCGKAQCHSSFKREVGDTYDTVEEARFTFIFNAQAVFPSDTHLAGNAPDQTSFIVKTLTTGVPSILYGPSETVRMPYDEPMPFEDIRLIERWVSEGVQGAQCLPNGQGQGCLGPTAPDKVVECDNDGNVLQGPAVSCLATGTCTSATDECISGICMPVLMTCGQGTQCNNGACVSAVGP